MKICATCNKTKDETEFYKNNRRRDGLQRDCKLCQSEKGKAWRERNPGYSRSWHFQNRYGITLEERNALATNGCEICGSMDNLHVDHDHHLEIVRGILCGKCNVLIGFADENEEILESAIRYLERWGERLKEKL